MTPQEPFSVRQFLAVLRRRRLVVVQVAAVIGLAALVLASRSPSEYHATAVLLTDTKTLPIEGLSDSQQLAPGTAARLVRTRDVAERVKRALSSDLSVDALLARVTTSANADGFTSVTATGHSGGEAATIANAFANQFVAQRAETPYVGLRKAVQAIQRQLRTARGDERSTLLGQLAQLRTLAALPAADVEVVDPAVAPGAPTGPDLLFALIAGLGLGVALGIVLALTLEVLDPRLKSYAEVHRLVQAPQLAGIPADVFKRPLRPRSRREPRVGRASRMHPGAFERLRTSLVVFNAERDLKTLLVTSPRDEREGKTTVASNLALSLAKIGLKVCAVDADLRRPRLARHFGFENEPGLAEVLDGSRLDDVLQSFPVPGVTVPTNGNGRKAHAHDLAVLPAGNHAGSPADALAGDDMQALLETLEQRFDVVIVDCAPVLAEADALPLLPRASGTILVVRLFHSAREATARAAQVIEEANGGLVGVVGTGVPARELREEGYGPWPAAHREAAGVG